ncbi:hypothetical protein ABUE31_03060 [Mesorhizobium sp. ZMM04-5]|uniref:Uncharacterized protein n=1 Tax=Mesorhizobium marinum TaxID=3228790 RepID=A0ABV3QVV3_9HYPH
MTEPPTVPLPPLCLGPPTHLWLDTFRSDEDLRRFWRGYVIGGACCAALLAAEISVVVVFL